MNRLYMSKRSVWLYLLLPFLLLGNGFLDARKVDLLIAIPLYVPSLKTVKNRISQIKKQIKIAAEKAGYEFDVDAADSSKMHISLERIVDVDEENVDKYLSCVRSIATRVEPFDLTEELKEARFALLGWDKSWGVLSIPSSKKESLNLLFHDIRRCLKESHLRKGPYKELEAHISLVKFLKNDDSKIPSSDNLSWIPAIDMSLPARSCRVDMLVVMARERVINKKTGTFNFIQLPDTTFLLGHKAAVAEKIKKEKIKPMKKKKLVSNKEIKTKEKPVKVAPDTTAISLLEAKTSTTRVVPLFIHDTEKQLLKNIREDIRYILEEEALESAVVNPDNVDKRIGELKYVRGLFNKKLLRGKDAIVELSEFDTVLFEQLPELLQEELLDNYGIQLFQSDEMNKKSETSHVSLSTKEKIEEKSTPKAADTTTQKSIEKKIQSKTSSSPVAAASLAKVKTKAQAEKIVKVPLFKNDRVKQQFSVLFQLKKGGIAPTQEETEKDIRQILIKETLKNPGVNAENVETKYGDLTYVWDLFNEKLFNRKKTDLACKLSPSDTMIFNALPESLKKDILSESKIILGKPKKIKAKPAKPKKAAIASEVIAPSAVTTDQPVEEPAIIKTEEEIVPVESITSTSVPAEAEKAPKIQYSVPEKRKPKADRKKASQESDM